MTQPDSSLIPMPFEGQRFFEAVQMFSDEIKLKYLQVLWFYWNHTKCSGINDDEEGLNELCRCSSGDFKRCRALIFDNDKFFKLVDGKWHQKRCYRFYQKVLDRVNQTEKARKTPRKPKEQIPVTNSVTEEYIYKAYPLKVGKPAALKAIKRAMTKIEPEKLLELTLAYAKRRNGDLAFVPNPSTWFNQERFNDDPSTWTKDESATKKPSVGNVPNRPPGGNL